MTTYSPDFTPRWKGTYVAAGVQHSIQFRGARGDTFSTMDGYKDRAREIFEAMAGDLADDFAWVKAEIALTDSDVFIPATTPTVSVSGDNAVALYSPMKKISGLTFSGKTPTGRARFTMYGLLYLSDGPTGLGADGIITPAEAGGITSVVSTAGTYFKGNSGETAVWYNRATYKPNDHLLKLVRRGIIS